MAEVRRGASGALGGVVLAGRIDGGRGIPRGPSRRYPGYALVLVTAGTGRYRDRRHDVPIGPGTLITVSPDEPHWYGVIGPATWDEVYLVFGGPMFVLAEARGVLDRSRPLRRMLPVPYWQHRLERFRTRRPPRTPAERDAEACEVLRLLVDVQVATEPQPASAGGEDWFLRSQQGLESDLGESVDLAGLAQEVGMPYETWRRHFRDRAGVPPARYRLLRRVDAAVGLLAHTTAPVREVAAAVGFSDEHHLRRHVRAVTGLTPGQHRHAQVPPGELEPVESEPPTRPRPTWAR